MSHPNATAAGATGIGAGIVVATITWLLSLFGVTVPDPPLAVGIFIGGLVSSFVLLIGREGLRGLGRRIWRGGG